ncbi:uncharacterized protein LOC129080580 [Pteronotus mesoamericanus]|uniref:uncharacterized protein LOC129080580 n=1 Tax=Pteronotus mesoamericanus TaxID=1884717 RepID=UPI0023ED3A5D|nr:uncharacterized protein LOC129080580 [Pteronotus parnellii mesoamericanus]
MGAGCGAGVGGVWGWGRGSSASARSARDPASATPSEPHPPPPAALSSTPFPQLRGAARSPIPWHLAFPGGERGLAPGGAQPSGLAGVPRGAAPLEDARRALATGGARRASSCSVLDSASPACSEVASPQLGSHSTGGLGATTVPRSSPALDRGAAFPDPVLGLHHPFSRVPRIQRPPTAPNSKAPPEPLHLPGPLLRAASGYSPPKARGAAASLGSPPGSPNLVFSSEPPERLAVEISCNVAYHPGCAGACGSAFCPAPCPRRGAPGSSAA